MMKTPERIALATEATHLRQIASRKSPTRVPMNPQRYYTFIEAPNMASLSAIATSLLVGASAHAQKVRANREARTQLNIEKPTT